MGTETNKDIDRNSPEYLAQLLKDRKQIQAFPNVFLHLERILDDEINKVRGNLFHLNTNKEPLTLPDGQGPPVSLSEKLYVPVKQHPDFNFVGRILGPRGMTAKQLEQDTGCKIMVRGKGSMRDKKKEELNRGKPNWEHLNEELHVLITVEDTTNRAEMKLRRAVDEVRKLLVPAPEGEDDLKKRQLMELAIINGTYRDTTKAVGAATQQNPGAPQTMTHYLGEELAKFGQARTIMTSQHSEAPRMIGPPLAFPPHLRSPTPAGAPIILAPRMPTIATSAAHHAGLLNGGPPPLVSPADAGLIYSYADPYGLAGATPILEYPGSVDHSAAGAVPKVRRTVAGMREHPYQRVSLA